MRILIAFERKQDLAQDVRKQFNKYTMCWLIRLKLVVFVFENANKTT